MPIRLLGVAVVILLAACGGTAIPSPSASAGPGTDIPVGPVQVTLGIFSGRPDPTWVLTEGEAAALEAALQRLPAALGRPPAGGLGYRGFTIERPDGSLVAFAGAVAPGGDAARTYLADPGRTVERLLAETARAHVGAAELTEVLKALATP